MYLNNNIDDDVSVTLLLLTKNTFSFSIRVLLSLTLSFIPLLYDSLVVSLLALHCNQQQCVAVPQQAVAIKNRESAQLAVAVQKVVGAIITSTWHCQIKVVAPVIC